ncbi:MAG: hypothetical protein WC782_02390 [Methylococcaceae bacterium]|jgi:hypothetical protein
MNIIKTTALSFFMAISLGASAIAFAEETTSVATSSASATIEHLEKALEEVNKSDFSTARLHFKAARSAAENLSGDEAILKQASALVIQGQVQANGGNRQQSADKLSKAIELYKSL